MKPLWPAAAGLAVLAGLVAWLWPAAEDGVVMAQQLAAAGQDLPPALTPPPGAASSATTELVGLPVLLQQQQALPPAAALLALKRCYLADRCGGTPSEGLETHFAVSKAISERLTALPANGDVAEQAALAREFLAFPDGHVQAAALALAARLPQDTATVNATVTALADSYDQLLFRKALPVLQQWQAVGLSSGYDDMLATTLQTGGIHAAQVVAENLLPFVNDANIGRYEALAQGMQPGARATALRQSLRDYRLLKTGG